MRLLSAVQHLVDHREFTLVVPKDCRLWAADAVSKGRFIMPLSLRSDRCASEGDRYIIPLLSPLNHKNQRRFLPNLDEDFAKLIVVGDAGLVDLAE